MMKELALVMGLALVFLASPNNPTVADESHWIINAAWKDKMRDFILHSPIIADMRTYEVKNDMVFADTSGNLGILPVYDLLACMHFTNPNSKMDVDSGGGFDIEVEEAQFAKGKWDAYVRIIEQDDINMLEDTRTLVLDKMTVGDTRLRLKDARVQALKMLSAACFTAPTS